MKLEDKRIIKFIKGKHNSEFDLEKFLNPSESDLRDANKLKNIDKAVEKIKTAIAENKKILVYGDYDSDGICSTTILYLYFKSIGANVDVFIPNRFEISSLTLYVRHDNKYPKSPMVIISNNAQTGTSEYPTLL